jgi:hypothetical protein
MRRVALLAVAIAVAAVPGAGGGGIATTAAPPAGLAASGRTLWQFEALLYDTFHQRRVSARFLRARAEWDFACGGWDCGPLSDWSLYFPTFSRARGSAFHLSSRRFPGGYFGVHPLAIKIKGRYVACDRGERRFLISYGTAVGLGLACLRG